MRHLAPWLVLLSLTACSSVRTVEDVPYVAGSDLDKHKLDLYLPAEGGDFPVVHFVHGGSWSSGDRDYYAWLTGLYGNVAEALAERGIAAVVQSYRLAPQVGIEAQLADVARAVRWTQEHVAEYGGDPQRLVLMGHSAGGHLVSLVGLDPTHLEAVGADPSVIRGIVPLSAVWDVAHMRAESGDAYNARVTDPVFLAGSDEAPAQRLARFSPVSYVEDGSRPLLVLVGEQDYPVISAQHEQVAARLTELGARFEAHVIPGYAHEDMVLEVGDHDDAVTPRVAAFVEQVCPPTSAAPLADVSPR